MNEIGSSTDARERASAREAASPNAASPQLTGDAASRPRHTPRRTVINYWVDLGLLVIFLALTWVTGVTQFVFPAGPDAFGYTLWGGSYGDWRDVQFSLTVALGLGVLLHLMLHWNWLCSVTNTHVRNRPPGRDDGSRTLLGVGLLVAILHLLAVGLLLAWWAIEGPRSV